MPKYFGHMERHGLKITTYTTMKKDRLRRIGACSSIIMSSGQSLLLKSKLYSLVILDVMMQKMNGFELYHQIKKKDPGIKVCFLTASSEMYREQLMKERHCTLDKDLFLNMPLPLKEIIDEVTRRIE